MVTVEKLQIYFSLLNHVRGFVWFYFDNTKL